MNEVDIAGHLEPHCMTKAKLELGKLCEGEHKLNLKNQSSGASTQASSGSPTLLSRDGLITNDLENVEDNATSAIGEKMTRDSIEVVNFERIRDYGAATGESDEEETDDSSVSSFSKDNVFGKLDSRDVHQEQLIQLVAEKMREGQILLENRLPTVWQQKKDSLSSNIYTSVQNGVFWIKCEMEILLPFSILQRQIGSALLKPTYDETVDKVKELEKLSSNCYINYERCKNQSLAPSDALMLRLQRKPCDQSLKVAEISIEDKRCPPIPGITRKHTELLFWQLSQLTSNDCEAAQLSLLLGVNAEGQELSTISKEALYRAEMLLKNLSLPSLSKH